MWKQQEIQWKIFCDASRAHEAAQWVRFKLKLPWLPFVDPRSVPRPDKRWIRAPKPVYFGSRSIFAKRGLQKWFKNYFVLCSTKRLRHKNKRNWRRPINGNGYKINLRSRAFSRPFLKFRFRRFRFKAFVAGYNTTVVLRDIRKRSLYDTLRTKPFLHFLQNRFTKSFSKKLGYVSPTSQRGSFSRKVWKKYKHWNRIAYGDQRKVTRFALSLNSRFGVSKYKFNFYRRRSIRRLRRKKGFVGVYHCYPWLNPLMYKKRLYKVNRRTVHLRMKMPSYHKRNRVYWQYTKILFNRWTPSIKRRQYFRLKTILQKIVLAFYGHLKLKQFKVIVASNNRLTSRMFPKMSMLLNKLERRLDVAVYRMNFAPTIQWSRELIRLGMITVNGVTTTESKYLVPNFCLIQYNINKALATRIAHFFPKKLLNKIIPDYLSVDAKLRSGLFIKAPRISSFAKNDRVNFSNFNIVRLINS